MGTRLKTLLLNIPLNMEDVRDYSGVLQPAGLSAISAFLKQQGCDVVFYDAFAHHLNRQQIIDYVCALKPDLLGVSLFTNHLPQALPLLAELKRLLPELVTLVGGAHPSSAYGNLLELYPEIDIAVIGEGEYALLEVIECLENHRSLETVQGISYRYAGQVKTNSPRPFIDDLDQLPYSDWAALPMEKYWEIWTVKKNYAHMILSRGCPFGCTFCGAKEALGRKTRKRSPQHILGEIELLYDRYDVRNILFGDSTLNMDGDWLKEICAGLQNRKGKIIWNCNLRADLLTAEQARQLKRSGCHRVFLGVESADNRMLKRMQKGESIEKVEQGIRYLQEAGINPDMGFIFGMPGETEESMQKTIEFAKRYPQSVCAFTLAAPFPGTPFYEEARQSGLVIDDWSKFDIYSVAYVPDGLTKQQLQDYYRQAVKSTYLRPSFMLSQLLQVRSLISLGINMRFAWRIFAERLLKL
jgi:radical SAM superfamily enzyme YgiQ (UPF0313 family)